MTFEEWYRRRVRSGGTFEAKVIANDAWDAAPTAARAWQPIETAPRDGAWFVIRVTDGKDVWFEAGCYEPLMGEKFVEAEGGLYRKIAGPIYEWTGFNNFHMATAWTVLLEPPEAK